MIDQAGHFFQAFLDIQGFQNLLLFFQGGINDGGDHVREDTGRGDGLCHGAEFLGQKRGELYDPVEKIHQISHQCFDLKVFDFLIFKGFYPGLDIGFLFHEGYNSEPADPLNQQLCLVIGCFSHFQNHAARADRMKIFRLIFGFRGGFFGHDQTDQPIFRHRFIHQRHRLIAKNFHGKHHFRKNKNIKQGQDRKNFRNFYNFQFFRGSLFRHHEPPKKANQPF